MRIRSISAFYHDSAITLIEDGLVAAAAQEEHFSRRKRDADFTRHADYSARLQAVHKETNPGYHALPTAFKNRTGCPVLVNTSFNDRGGAIVCTPEEAFTCFMGTEIEALAVGNCFLKKVDQDPSLRDRCKDSCELD